MGKIHVILNIENKNRLIVKSDNAKNATAATMEIGVILSKKKIIEDSLKTVKFGLSNNNEKYLILCEGKNKQDVDDCIKGKLDTVDYEWAE